MAHMFVFLLLLLAACPQFPGLQQSTTLLVIPLEREIKRSDPYLLFPPLYNDCECDWLILWFVAIYGIIQLN